MHFWWVSLVFKIQKHTSDKEKTNYIFLETAIIFGWRICD